MKFTPFVALAICAGLPVMADTPILAKGDSTVSFYGILDAGVGTVAHSLNFDSEFPASTYPIGTKFAPSTSATGMFNGGISGSRLGLRGSADLGDGWKAVFNAESMINVPSGTLSNAAIGMANGKASAITGNMSGDSAISGQLFSRQIYVGIGNDMCGTLSFGRHTSFGLELIGGYDPLQASQIFTPIGFAGSYSGGGATDNSRVDNSVKYRVKVGNWNAGVMHKFGGVSGASTAQGANLLNLGYEQGSFGVQYMYQAFTDAFSVGNPADTFSNVNVVTKENGAASTIVPTQVILAPLGTIGLTAYNTTASMLVARYKVGPVYLKGGYEYMKFDNPSNPIQDGQVESLFGIAVSQKAITDPTGASSTTGTTTTLGQVLVPNVSVTAYSTGEKTLKVYWLGAAWDITSKLNLGAAYYHVTQNDYSGKPQGAELVASNAGHSKFTSCLLDYHFTQKFDVYAGYMTNTLDGGMAVGYVSDSNSVTGLGLRYAF